MASNKRNFSYNVSLDLDIESFKQEAKELQTYKFLNPESQKQWEEMVGQARKMKAEVKMLQKSLEEIEDLHGPEFDDMRKAIQEQIDELTKEDKEAEKRKDAKESLQKMFRDLGKQAQQLVTDFFKDIYNKAIEMLEDIATYSEHSMKYSEEATDLRLSYGLSGAQAYAYQQAAKEAGFGSFEGYIENAAFASQETLQRFDELLVKYEKSYEQSKEVAESYQKFQTSFNDFKNQLSMSLIDFFMENKDTIMDVLEAGVEMLKGILQFVGWLVSVFSSGRDRSDYDRQSALSDIYNSYGANKTTNIKIDNSFQGVSPSDRSTYANAGEMTYRQVIAALK